MILPIRGSTVAAARVALFHGPHARGTHQPTMAKRAPRSHWSQVELDVLKHLLFIYGYRELDYKRAASLFENRTPREVKQRCICIRDQEQRKRKRELHLQQAQEEPDSPTSVTHLLPPEGRLHPTLVWVPSTAGDIGQVNL